jgi:hypothetical protein
MRQGIQLPQIGGNLFIENKDTQTDEQIVEQ